jgi:hypothetical protein
MVLLGAESLEIAVFDAGSPPARDAHGVILAAAVDHDALVAEYQAVEASPDVACFVSGDDDGT